MDNASHIDLETYKATLKHKHEIASLSTARACDSNVSLRAGISVVS